MTLTPDQKNQAAKYVSSIFHLIIGIADRCPRCGTKALPLKQVNNSVYGACGCRLFTGQLGGDK